mgnify:CR=1 FL=1
MAKKKNKAREVDYHTSTTAGFGLDDLPKGYGHLCNYRYKVNTNSYCIGYQLIDWLKENCVSKWGWIFVPKVEKLDWADHYQGYNAVLTFKSKNDAVYYMLTHEHKR